MMGRRVVAEPLFYTFRLEERVPANRPLRSVDALLNTSFVRRVVASYYSAIGRPSIDPELIIRMLLVGYLGGIRSERKLCAEVHLNLYGFAKNEQDNIGQNELASLREIVAAWLGADAARIARAVGKRELHVAACNHRRSCSQIAAFPARIGCQ